MFPNARLGRACAVSARFALAVLPLLVLAPEAASGQGLTLRLAPDARAVRWDEALALRDASFFGGGLSLGFGRYVTLHGGYATAGTLRTSFAEAGFAAPDGSVPADNDVGTDLFHGAVLLRLGDRSVAPILVARGGILSLEPEGRDRTRQIFAGYGTGLDLRLTPWLDGQVSVERVALRMDRGLLTRGTSGSVPDPDAAFTRNSLAVGASLGVRLGASRSSRLADDADAGLGQLLAGSTEGLMIPLEAQVGVIRFADALGLEDQRTIGIRTGLDFGPYFGVRGVYWRGVTDSFDEMSGVRGWSGEVQFNLGRVTGASPHLIVGAGQTSFTEDFRSSAPVALDDENHLVLGGGVGFPIGSRARLTVTLRDHIFASGELAEAATPSDLRHNVSLSGGLSVLLFGGAGRSGGRGAARRASDADTTDYRSDQTLNIPLPKQGELYVRYGPGARTLPGGAEGMGVDSAAVRLAVMAELGAILEGGAAVLSDSARTALEARVMERLRGLPSTPDSAGVGRPSPTGVDTVDPAVAALQRQVDELTRLVRESMLLQAAGTIIRPGGTSVTVVTGGAEGAGDGQEQAAPFLRAVEARLARTSMDDGQGGLALSAEAYLNALTGSDHLIPFMGLDIGRNGVDRTVDGASARGSVRSLGMDFGVTGVLPRLGPVWPTVGLFLSAAREGASGDTPLDDEALDERYGGLSVGPGIAIGAGYRPDPGQRTLITGALRKVWSGAPSRWSLEVGMRLTFGARTGPPSVGPFSVRPPATSTPRDTVQPDTAALDTLPAGTRGDSATARLLARMDSLEAQVVREADARRRAESLADSLRAMATEEAETEQRATEARAAVRAEVLRNLEALAEASPIVVALTADDDGFRVVLGGPLFAVGATELADDARQDIAMLGGLLAQLEGAEGSVEGHTDNTGTEETNLTISRMRATSVARALEEGGAPSETLNILGHGQSIPAADNGTRAGRAENRRVEIVVRWGR